MTNDEVIKEVKNIIKDYLLLKKAGNDAKMIEFDDKYLLAHIKAMIALFEKAKKLLEKEKSKHE